MTRILETTIRDGSYEIDFQFTRQDVAVLAGLLDLAGFRYIEVGHGNGLGGEVFGQEGAASDEAYLKAARRAVRRAELGALLGFTKRPREQILDKVRLAAEEGLDFLRMGFVPRRSEEPMIVESIELAKRLGLTVSVNFMRTYTAPPAEIEARSRQVADLGVDWIYIVDSAGGMTPDQIKEYVQAIRRSGVSAVGFHGHNNIQHAVANSLAAVEAGASMIDTSLQGLGRATGNAQTEVILALFQTRYGSETEIDRELVHNIAREWVRPRVEAGFEPTHVLAGSLNVHSSSLPQIEASARDHEISPDTLLAAAGARAAKAGALDTRDLPEDIVRTSCEGIERGGGPDVDPRQMAHEAARYSQGPPADVEDMLQRLKVYALRDRVKTGIAVVPASGWPFSGLGIVHRVGWAFGILPVSDASEAPLRELLSSSWAGEVFVAEEVLSSPGLPEAQGAVHTYGFDAVTAEAAVAGLETVPTLVAVASAGLREAILARLSPRAEVTVAEVPRVPRGPYGHVLLEGSLVKGDVAELEQASEGATLTLLGRDGFPGSATAKLCSQSGGVRLPDIAPLLAARAEMSPRVRVEFGDLNRAIEALEARDPGLGVAWNGHLIEAGRELEVGPANAGGEAASGYEAAVAAHAVRVARLTNASARRRG